MIISVHLPKTAGTSFIKTLKSVYGNNVLEDYADKPLNTAPFKRKSVATLKRIKNRFRDFKDIECVHGHFLPYKYSLQPYDVFYVTWMREPVERLASHYYYWKKTYNKNLSFSLQKKIVEENWSLERFLFSKELRNIYSEFLWRCPLEKFDFIGITEFYEDDLIYFSEKFMGIKATEFKENVNTKLSNVYITDKSLREKVEEFHEKDMILYRKALKLRNERI